MIAFSLMLLAFEAPAPTVKDVAWISGCWDLTRNGRHVAEQWMPVEADTKGACGG